MKRFNWKLAARALSVVIAVNIALTFLDHIFPDNSALLAPFWIINFPGGALLYVVGNGIGWMPPHGDAPGFDLVVIAIVGAFSGLVWAGVAGFIFRHVRAA